MNLPTRYRNGARQRACKPAPVPCGCPEPQGDGYASGARVAPRLKHPTRGL